VTKAHLEKLRTIALFCRMFCCKIGVGRGGPRPEGQKSRPKAENGGKLLGDKAEQLLCLESANKGSLSRQL